MEKEKTPQGVREVQDPSSPASRERTHGISYRVAITGRRTQWREPKLGSGSASSTAAPTAQRLRRRLAEQRLEDARATRSALRAAMAQRLRRSEQIQDQLQKLAMEEEEMQAAMEKDGKALAEAEEHVNILERGLGRPLAPGGQRDMSAAERLQRHLQQTVALAVQMGEESGLVDPVSFVSAIEVQIGELQTKALQAAAGIQETDSEEEGDDMDDKKPIPDEDLNLSGASGEDGERRAKGRARAAKRNKAHAHQEEATNVQAAAEAPWSLAMAPRTKKLLKAAGALDEQSLEEIGKRIQEMQSATRKKKGGKSKGNGKGTAADNAGSASTAAASAWAAGPPLVPGVPLPQPGLPGGTDTPIAQPTTPLGGTRGAAPGTPVASLFAVRGTPGGQPAERGVLGRQPTVDEWRECNQNRGGDGHHV